MRVNNSSRTANGNYGEERNNVSFKAGLSCKLLKTRPLS